ncbi:MAG: Blue-light-activated protein [Verrucomicrobiales bacterium]|nr:Blue-light-activated protein [Verrucomicrobiales bacterium]
MNNVSVSTTNNVASTQMTPSGPTPSGSRTIKVLLLEDVVSDAELIQRELRKAGLVFDTRCVETKDDYLRTLKEFGPDIVLSDYNMPQFNAMEALQLLRETGQEIAFVLVTGTQSEEVAVQCMKEGADDYILKTSLKRLPSAVWNAIEKRDFQRQRQHAMRALQKSEEHFRSLIENALDIIVILNPDGTFRYASPSVKGLGYMPEELVGRNLLHFVSQDDAQEVSTIFHRILENCESSQIIEFLFRHKNNSWRVLESFGKCINPNTPAVGIVINARDVSERKESEAEIEKLAAFPRLNPNPTYEISVDGKVNYFNNSAAEMAQAMGTSPAELLPNDTLLFVQDVLRSGKSVSRESTSGNRILAWSFFPIITRQVVHCYAFDITERVNLETQLRQSQKMESVGQLAAGVAHDFNNFLTLIRGYAGLMSMNEELADDEKEALQEISAAAERAANLTRQLLTFSRKQVMQPQELELNETVSDVAKMLHRILGEDIALHFNYAPNLPPIHADAGMMEQVLLNLAVNARDAMPRGGTLNISTEVSRINEVHVRKNSEARVGTFVCLRVSDGGTGIPKEVLPRIFEPFFTTKDVGKGTGLGLATVYGIVKQHQGWIEVLSGVGQGTTFRLFFPTSQMETQKTVEVKPANAKVQGGSEKILLVEDEPEVRVLVRNILKRYGYRIIEAASGPEAILVWEQYHGDFDLLLTDMVMPGNMTGRELGEQLKARKPGLKVIYTSGYSADTLGSDFVIKRGINFLPKPYQPITLAKTVRDCLDT